MKTKQLLATAGAVKVLTAKALVGAMFAAALLFSSSALFAQVKIGTNPTTINAANNLEVEASTAGNKVSVDKTTGKVTIADGSQGVDKVLTSDANGVATWQTQSVGCASFEASRAAQVVPINVPPAQGYTTLIATTETYDPANAYNPVTGEYTVPVNGFYAFKGTEGDNIPGVVSASRNSTIAIFSASKGILAFSVVQGQPYANGSFNNITALNYLTAGDKITFGVAVVHTTGTLPATTINVNPIAFSGTRIDCTKN